MPKIPSIPTPSEDPKEQIKHNVRLSCEVMLSSTIYRIKEKAKKIEEEKNDLAKLQAILSQLISQYSEFKKNLEDYVEYNTTLIKERQKKIYTLNG